MSITDSFSQKIYAALTNDRRYCDNHLAWTRANPLCTQQEAAAVNFTSIFAYFKLLLLCFC
jgi:hypothetical protein